MNYRNEKPQPKSIMERIETLDEFMAFIKRKLGDPIVDIEMTDEQLLDVMFEVLSYYQEFSDEATQLTSIRFTMNTKASPSVVKLPESVFTVNAVYTSGLGADHLMRFQSFTPGFTHFYGSNSRHFSAYGMTFDLVTFQLLKEYFGVLETFRQNKVHYLYNRNTKELTMHFPRNFEAPFDIYIEAATLLDPEDWPDIYNRRWFRSAVEAKARIQWGRNLIKFGTLEMDGGYKIEPQLLIDQGNADWDVLYEQLHSVINPPPRMMVG